MAEPVVVDASAMIDLVVGTSLAPRIAEHLRGHEMHAPAHFDAEVLSALGRLHRNGDMTAAQVGIRLRTVADAPVQRHLVAPLLTAAWGLRHNLRLVDAVYVALATELQAPIITTDAGLAAAAPGAEHITETD